LWGLYRDSLQESLPALTSVRTTISYLLWVRIILVDLSFFKLIDFYFTFA
jgi:hypothetical protein